MPGKLADGSRTRKLPLHEDFVPVARGQPVRYLSPVPKRLTQVDERLWTCSTPLKVALVSIGHRMTVIQLLDGNLVVHSPCSPDPDVIEDVRKLGPVTHIVAPSRMHNLYLEDWLTAFPGAKLVGAPEMDADNRNLPFKQILGIEGEVGGYSELLYRLVEGAPKFNELAFFHLPTSTLIVADLLFNVREKQGLLGNLALRAYGTDKGPAASRLFRVLTNDEHALKLSLNRILMWDFDRIIVGHGEIIESGGKTILQQAWRLD